MLSLSLNGLVAIDPIFSLKFQGGGFKLPFIVMGSLLLSILPVVLIILPRDESKYKSRSSLYFTYLFSEHVHYYYI